MARARGESAGPGVDARGTLEAAQGAQGRRSRSVRTAETIGGQQRLKSQCPSLISIYN
jgi:hypothetical protein